MKSIYFLGSSFIKKLSSFFPENSYNIGCMTGISFLSNRQRMESDNKFKDWLEVLDSEWTNNIYDCLVMDMRSICMLIYKSKSIKDGILTLSSDNLPDNCPKKRIYDPFDMSKEEVCERIEQLTEVVRTHFNHRQIILISNFGPKFYTMGTQLRTVPNNTEWTVRNIFIKKFENYFISKTKAVVSNLADKYFYKKEEGFELTNYIYEDEYYLNLAENIMAYVDNGMINFSDKQNFRISLERYCKYYHNVKFEALYTIFQKGNLLEEMIVACSDAFVSENMNELVKLHDMPETLSDNEPVKKIFEAYTAVENGNYTDENIDYKILFKNSIISAKALKVLSAECADNSLVSNKKLVSIYNAGYYFALLNGKDKNEAITYCCDDKCISPSFVDIYGSCITKTCFKKRYAEDHQLLINNCWFQVPIYRNVEGAVKYPENIFTGILDLKDRNLKAQFDNTIFDEIKNSDGEWLVVDIFSFITTKTFEYNGFLFTDHNNKLWKKLKANKVDISSISIDNLPFFNDIHELEKCMEKWCCSVLEKYGDNIILFDVYSSDVFIGDDKVIYRLFNSEQTERKNAFLRYIFNYLSKKLNCYTLDMTKYFLADDKGYIARASVHYSLEYYQFMHDAVKNIIDNKPKEKYVSFYPSTYRVNLLLDLMKVNDLSVLHGIFREKTDKIVLALKYETIEKYKEQIINWYDRKICNKEEIISLYNGRSEFNELINEVSDIQFSSEYPMKDLPVTYKSYMPPHPKYDIFERTAAPSYMYRTIEFDANGADEGEMPPVKFIYGVKTKIAKNQFKYKGYEFIGWKAIRNSDNKTVYSNESGKIKFFEENKQPEGFELYLYPDQSQIVKLSNADNDIIRFYAQWKKTEK